MWWVPITVLVPSPRLCTPDPEEPQNAEAYAQACEALAAATNPELSAITSPVLLITGDEDAVSPPATNEAIAGELTNAQRHTIPGIGHWTLLEAPDFVADYLTTFLQDT